MPGAIDTAVAIPGQGTYVFAGDRVWRYRHGRREPDPGYPKPITAEFPGVFARALDAALVHPDGDLLLFRRNQQIRYDLAAGKPRIGYPRPYAGDWAGVFPDRIDAALRWGPDVIYIFAGDRYTSFSPQRAATRPGFPKLISGNWTGIGAGPVRAALALPDGRRVLISDSTAQAYDVEGRALAWGLSDLPALDGGAHEADSSSAIEPLHYDNTGTACSGRAQPGAVALRDELRRRFAGRDGGIYNCRPIRGATRLSLHGEGRALDWTLSAAHPAERAAADRIIAWLLDPDAAGNRFALARRMGVQEIIWNHRIWSAVRPQWRPYHGVDPHTGHIHVGLNWAGAHKETSFWRSQGPQSSPAPTAVAPTPKPAQPPAPARGDSVGTLASAADIGALFNARTGCGFLDWFHATQAKRGAWASRDVARDADTRRRFIKVWNRIPEMFETAAITLEQFVALQSIFINELGGRLAPISEQLAHGRPGHPGLAYLFDRIPGVKASYNQRPNKTALECFNEPSFIAAHRQRSLGDQLAGTSDGAWGGASYPPGVPTDVAGAGFVAEADFCKFRGRGLIQTTWRTAYTGLVRFVQGYAGPNGKVAEYRDRWAGKDPDTVCFASSNADWDSLFENTDYVIACAGIRLHNRGAHNYLAISPDPAIQRGTGPGSFHRMGLRISGSSRYGALFARRCAQILDALGAAVPVHAPTPPAPPPSGPPALQRTPGPSSTGLSAGREELRDTPLLKEHHGTQPDLILRWNDLPAGIQSVDVVVHLHGYSGRGARMSLVRDKEPNSGVELAARPRPTVAILPRGHYTGGKTGMAYTFPALVRPTALNELIGYALGHLAQRTGGPLTVARLILTAHSGGGAPLNAILAHAGNNPDEIHVFDALYGSPAHLTAWATRRLARDRDSARAAADPRALLAAQGGALRILYIPGAGTDKHSLEVKRALAPLISDAGVAQAALAARYRVEPTRTGHSDIPRTFGGSLLADAARDLAPSGPAARDTEVSDDPVPGHHRETSAAAAPTRLRSKRFTESTARSELELVAIGRLRLGRPRDPQHPAPIRSTGAAVREVQLALIELGHRLPLSGADGRYGDETYQTVLAYKRKHNIRTAGGYLDGIVGPKTIGHVDAALPLPPCPLPGAEAVAAPGGVSLVPGLTCTPQIGPTLDELKRKWFIDPGAQGQFPPTARHAGSAVRTFTDGNTVTPLIDGSAFMGRWADAVDAMRVSPRASECEVWHTGWRFEGVETRGHRDPSSDALEMLNRADSAGVNVLAILSRHVPGLPFNNATVIWFRAHNVWKVVMDNRFPVGGSGHQKFSCMRNPADPHVLLGSIDISKTRWDTPRHLHSDPDRNPTFGKPTHDTGVAIRGPAVADVELTFIERWNDSTRTFGLDPLLPPLPKITRPPSATAAVGTHSVQVLHSYGRASKAMGYSWSPAGEFTVWAAYLKAIRAATRYIYIEDQYFLPFGFPPAFLGTGLRRDTDLVYQIGEAIKRGVRVLVVVPSNAEDAAHTYQKYQRDLGVEYLRTIAASQAATGDFVIASLTNGTSDVYVHSKLMILDDEHVLIGSANVGQRSMTFDSELHIGVVDAAGAFARDFRIALWREHLDSPASPDPVSGYALIKAAVAGPNPSGRGHLKPYPWAPTGSPPAGHAAAMQAIDPYGGPSL